jgi:hypothetical protein
VRLITINAQPYTVINGKDFAVYRWFSPGQHGPLFIQVAGRTALSRDDLPQDDWIVLPGRDRGHRLATAWRKPWFDYRPDTARKLAFIGASTEGSFFLALRYLVRRFDLSIAETELAARSADLAQRSVLPSSHVIDRSADLALARIDLVTLDVPSYWSQTEAADFLAA